MRHTVLLASLAILVTSAHAIDAYSSFGADNLSNPDNTYLLGANVLYDFSSLGFRFTSTATGALSGLSAAINGGALPITFSLYADDAGSLGGSLGSWTTTASGAQYPDTSNAVASVAASGVGLTAGSTYWLVATNADAGPDHALSWNAALTEPSSSKRYALRSGTAFYYSGDLGAFSVAVSPVPEPASLAVLGLGAMALFRRRSR